MAAELRWILLGLSLLLLAGIWWWGARRGGQSPGNPELRESSVGKAPEPLSNLDSGVAGSSGSGMKADLSREWTVSPFEPLNIRTANFEEVPQLDEPMLVHPQPLDTADFAVRGAAPSAVPDAQAVASARIASARIASALPEPAQPTAPSAQALPPIDGDAEQSAAPQAPNAAEQQKIVTIRVCMLGEARLPGAQLAGALAAHGLAFGRYQVFHRKHVDGRSVFCVASMVEPGSFNMATMADELFRGVMLFAVLPGPLEAVEAFDELITTARGLAGKLSAMLQDAKGMPLSPQRVAALREEVARFQASLRKA